MVLGGLIRTWYVNFYSWDELGLPHLRLGFLHPAVAFDSSPNVPLMRISSSRCLKRGKHAPIFPCHASASPKSIDLHVFFNS